MLVPHRVERSLGAFDPFERASVIEAVSPVLIANRGEIAVRIIRTCRRLGIRSIAVYSDADRQALHVAEADAAVHIGASPAADSYLNIARILAAAEQAEARAIHPGYGFLAENPDFAERVISAGLVWVGPPPQAMRALGDKARAKALAEQHSVPVLDGYHGQDQSPETLRSHAERIGYPVLIKASAGGGGRGMRVVEAAEVFLDALEAAKREAQAAFGDDRVLLERYVARPRHVEVQIFGDNHGNLVHLGERECSIQRRHQKLIEESPSPVVSPAMRERMGEAALRLAGAAGYLNAGTVEFLLDERGEFAFLEVNARLQVEHPVTEAVTGLDLVELQFRVAAGEPLPLSQADVQLSGHAVEVRVIAEDALAGFLPSSGIVRHFELPDTVRVDTWVRDGTPVSPYYDSLLAKVIAYAASRAEAIAILADALKCAQLDGVCHNLDLLLATLESRDFIRGDLHTSFIEEQRLVEDLAEVPSPVLAAASALEHLRPVRVADPWQSRSAWRVARLDQPARWMRAARVHSAGVSADVGEPSVHVHVGRFSHLVRFSAPDRASVDDEALSVLDYQYLRLVNFRGRTYRLQPAGPLTVEDTAAGRHSAAGGGRLTAPMPGRIVKLGVHRGQQVAQNQPLLVLEAMKMEHTIEAPHTGTVTEIHVKLGEQVASGAQLLTLGPPSDQPATATH